MSVTILEALQNAQINLVENYKLDIARVIGTGQLNNAIILLEKGYDVYDEVEPLLDVYGDVNHVPAKQKP